MRVWARPIIVVLLVVFFTSPCTAGETRHYGKVSYSIARPSYCPAEGYKLLVFFHGQGGSEDQAIRFWGEDGPANGYIVIGPKSIGRTWSTKPSEIRAVHELIAHIQETEDIPRERTVAVGYSAGGAALFFYFLKFPDRLAGFCSVQGHSPVQFLPLMVKPRKVDVLALTGDRDSNLSSISHGSRYLRSQGYLVHSGTLRNTRHAYVKSKLNPVIVEWFANRLAAWRLRSLSQE